MIREAIEYNLYSAIISMAHEKRKKGRRATLVG
jgi:hypothetical protein